MLLLVAERPVWEHACVHAYVHSKVAPCLLVSELCTHTAGMMLETDGSEAYRLREELLEMKPQSPVQPTNN